MSRTKARPGLWLAKQRGGKSQIAVGPANDLKDLLSRVQDNIADFGPSDEATDNAEVSTELDEGETLLTEDHKGNTYLPGVEQVVDQQLKDAAFNEYTDKQAWNEAGKKKKESKAALEAMVAAKRHLFYEDPAKKSDLIYKVGGLTIRCAKEYSVKVKTEQTEEDDE
jgi:hypothetical protein